MGAASQLMSWGLGLADAHYLPTYVEATASGLPLYLKHGFQKVDTLEVDLRRWGWSHANTILVRPAKVPDPSIDQVVLSPFLTNKDITTFTPIEEKAFTPKADSNNPEEQKLLAIYSLINKDVKEDTVAFRVKALIRNAATDRTSHYIKAFIPRTNQIVGWAKWNFCPSPHIRPAEMPWPEGANMGLIDAFFGSMKRLQTKHMGGKPFCLEHALVVLPEWQRKGIGRRLLEWGLEYADREALESWIDASPEGLELYKKLGWMEVGETVVDMGEWGGEVGRKEKVVSLIRKPVIVLDQK